MAVKYIKLHLKPVSLKDANDFVASHHRHHKPVRGHKFSLCVIDDDGKMRGVVIVGRPVNRVLDDGCTLEVTRLTTDGVPNGCSMLYGAARKATIALAYTRLITYTLTEESGVSLRASGWVKVAVTQGGSWSTKNRPRIDKHPLQPKFRWEAPC